MRSPCFQHDSYDADCSSCVELNGGDTALVCGPAARAKQCRWCPVADGGKKTCDAPVCADHAKEVGPDRHYCPTHVRLQHSVAEQHSLFGGAA